jgi:APA family basic amino acid/polyamine antiporter
VYLQAAYGNLAAFLTGWTSFVAGFSGAIAASAVVLAAYVGRFAPAAADDTPIFTVPLGLVTLTVSPQSVVALAAIALMAFIHRRGVGPGRIVSNVLAALKVSSLLVFIALGFAFGRGSAANLQAGSGAVITSGAWLLALVPVMFTYSGWNAAAYVAEEIREPQRNLPRALAIGTIAVIAIYLFLNLLYLYVIPVASLAEVRGSVLDVIADRLLGSAAGDIMGVVSIVSIAASISAMTFAGPRVYYAMARDGLFVPAAARVHRRYRTPGTAIVAQAVWSGVLVLSGGAAALTRYTGFAVVLFAGVAVAAVFVLRTREPGRDLPFRAWGYPIAPAIFVLTSLAIVVNSMWSDPVPSLAGTAIIVAGVPVFLYFRRGARPAAQADEVLGAGAENSPAYSSKVKS